MAYNQGGNYARIAWDLLAMKSALLVFSFSVLVSSIWPLITLLISPFLILFFALYKNKYLSLSYAFLLGAIWVGWHWSVVNNSALTLEQGRQNWQLTGEVGRISKQKGRLEFDFYAQRPFEKLKISCYQCPWNIERGDQWSLALKLKPFSSFYNPVGFNYRRWMLAKGYTAYGSVDVKRPYNNKLTRDAYSLAKQINITLSEPRFPILRALLLGDKKTLPANFKRIINGSGLGHLFVISGLHVGMMALVVTLLLSWLQKVFLLKHWVFGPFFSVMGGFLAAVFYAYLSGFNVPVIRACIMLLFILLMLLRVKNRHISQYLFLALLSVMFIKPLAFMELGSWLSFVIVGALIFGMGVKGSWFGQLFTAQQIAFYSGGSILLVAGMGLAPVGFLLNLVFIPLISFLVLPAAVLGLGLALIGFENFLIIVEFALGEILEGLLSIEKVVTWAPAIHENNKILLLFALLLFIFPRALRFRTVAIILLVVALALPIQRPKKGGFTLTVLDVGQGSATLIETKNFNVLVDTGTRFMNGMAMVDYVISPHLKFRDIKHLDILHITHADIDHSGGKALLTDMSKALVEQDSCDAFSWVWDDVKFERFKAQEYEAGNNGSCLLRVSDSKGRKVLMTGDVEREAEYALVKQGAPLQADVLLVPHHGSKTSSTLTFLDAVSPNMAIISAGNLNHYGHPHSEIVQRLNSNSIEVYSTASHGAIQVDFDPRQESLSVSTYRPIFK